MIGLTEGSATAVVAAIMLGWSGVSLQVVGLLGGLACALVVYLLAWRGGTTGYRLILVGIGISWMCTSATDFLLARGGQFEAQAAVGWLVGNLNGRDWTETAPLAAAMLVLVPAALALGRLLRTLQLGDEVALGLGTPVQRARLGVMLTGVGLIARTIIPSTELPVGIVTGALGAPVLIWLLIRAHRAGSGG